MITTFILGAVILAIVTAVLWPVLPKTNPFRRASATPKVRVANESTFAREKAERDLEAVRSETPRYRALADDLRAKRERNHFADSIAASMSARRT